MKILNWYILKNYLLTFLMAIGILSFGFAGAHLLKVISFLEEGVPFFVALKFIFYLMPHLLCFVIPWASLVSIMLVFGRMSTDNEITAMRACGVSILQVVAPLIVLTILFTSLCLYLQFEAAPVGMERERDIGVETLTKYPLASFSAGQAISKSSILKDWSLYFSDRDEKDNIYNVQAYKIKDGKILLDATAARGRLESDAKAKTLRIILYDAIVDYRSNRDDDDDDAIGANKSAISGYTSEFYIDFDYSTQFNSGSVSLREKYLTVKDLLARIVLHKARGTDTTELETELAMRVNLALAPIAFLLLGLPVALSSTNRKESNIGLFISVALAGIYMANVLMFDAVRDQPNYYPQYLIWIVPAIYQIIGIFLLVKMAKK